MPLPRFADPFTPWNAAWVWHPDVKRDGWAVVRFRKRFDVVAPVSNLSLWVSADERFILFLDGKRIARGPSRSDASRWICTKVDTGPLSAGPHVLAATVFHFGADANGWGQMGARAGFLVRAESGTNLDAEVNTGPSWRCLYERSRTGLAPDRGGTNFFHCLGLGERFDGTKAPWGCEQLDYDDTRWVDAVCVDPAAPLGTRDPSAMHLLIPDPLPKLDEEEQRFARVAEAGMATGGQAPAGDDPAALADAKAWIGEDRALTIPPHTCCRLLLDKGEQTNAYPVLTVAGGAGAKIRTISVEALFRKDGTQFLKENRDETRGKLALGWADEFLPYGGDGQTFSTLWFRSYRYVQITVETGDDPLILQRIRSLFTGYPLRERASFKVDAEHEATYRRVWELSWRTARLCAHETYFDCPHYEQLQYVGDTRIQAIFSYLVANDDGLAKKAIEDFWSSRIVEGLTCSRHPSRIPQVIPPFSLYWIGMLNDFRIYRGDLSFIAGYMDTARSVMSWFANRRRKDGLLGPLEYWNFMDWVPGWPNGVPAGGGADGGSVLISLLLASAAQWMAALEDACGYAELAPRWRRLHEELIETAFGCAWDEGRGILADTSEKKVFSVHTNVQAVLAGVFDAHRAGQVLTRALEATDITPPGSHYFRFYVAQALKAAGMRTRFFDLLKTWEVLLTGTGLTTWPENDGNARSDCHAWSCSPNIEFIETILGVQPDPAANGFGRIIVTPALGPLREAQGVVPTPKGEIKVSLRREDGGTTSVELESPVPGVLISEATGKRQAFPVGRTATAV
jgi:hypothetical protein